MLVLEPREFIHEINNTTHKLSMLIQTEEIIFWSKHFHFRMNSQINIKMHILMMVQLFIGRFHGMNIIDFIPLSLL